jgi:hypothetical protein
MTKLTAWVFLVAAAFEGPVGYHVLGKMPIGGEGGWDYVTIDSNTRRLSIRQSNQAPPCGEIQ